MYTHTMTTSKNREHVCTWNPGAKKVTICRKKRQSRCGKQANPSPPKQRCVADRRTTPVKMNADHPCYGGEGFF